MNANKENKNNAKKKLKRLKKRLLLEIKLLELINS